MSSSLRRASEPTRPAPALARWSLPLALALAAAASLGGARVLGVGEAQPPASRTIDATAELLCPEPRTKGEKAARVGTGMQWGSGQVLTQASCTSATQDGWLVLNDARDADLELVNGDRTDAVVDLTLLGTKGLHRSVGTSKITVPAGGRRVVPISVQAPDGPVAIRVLASTGRVSAHARVQGKGFADALASAPLRTEAHLPVVAQGSAVTLLLANPTERPAAAQVRAHGRTGAFTPVGAERVEVPAQSVLAIALDKAFQDEQGSLEVTSQVALAASVQLRRGQADLALVRSSEATTQTTVDLPPGPVLVTNTSDQQAWVTLGDERVQVPAGATQQIVLDKGAHELTSDQPVVVGSVVPADPKALAVAVPIATSGVRQVPGLVNDPTAR